MHEAYISNLYANTNAIGSCFGGKNFKPIDPFDNKPQAKNNTMTADYVAKLKAFGIDAKDVSESTYKENWKEMSTEEKRKLLFNK